MISNLLRAVEIAKILGLSRSQVYRLMAQGTIPSIRIGKSIRARPEDLEKFLDENIVPEITTNQDFSNFLNSSFGKRGGLDNRIWS